MEASSSRTGNGGRPSSGQQQQQQQQQQSLLPPPPTSRANSRQQIDEEMEDLPTYEETIESATRKRYTLKYPQLMSRTVHAIDTDTGTVAYAKKVKGLTPSRMQIFKGSNTTASSALAWDCRRELHGFELVFTRRVDMPPPPPISLAPAFSHAHNSGRNTPASDSNHAEAFAVRESNCSNEPLDDDDDIGTTARLLDNKPADENREYLHKENDDAPPPAYEESEATSEQEIMLKSTYPFPFIYDFTFPDPQGEKLRWLHNQEAKNPSSVSQERPWTAFMCVDRSTGRLLAEVVHYTKKDSSLGTLIVHGDLDPDLHEFLIASAIPVIEEYPVRHLRYHTSP
ncbi:hypothetical protein GGI12_004201 [Dipsacomyces acuminosporus]|nr:hypothetical protein GGI12_004201 [Dipsacomyces acuminosporus]